MTPRKRKRWCVRHRDGWCIRKDESKAARDADDFTAIETLCDHWITLPGGLERRRPTCRECVAAEDAERQPAAYAGVEWRPRGDAS